MSYAYHPPAGQPLGQSSGYYLLTSEGVSVVPRPTEPPKSLAVAVILSLVLPGLGDLYSDNTAAAVLWWIAAITAWLSVLILIGILLVPLVMFGACVHAYYSAAIYNERHHLGG